MSESQVNEQGSLPPGHRLGKYLVKRELGRGAMGVVYLAVQENLNRQVALKICPVSADRVSRFRREALAVARLNHPHIVQVYDVEQVDDLHVIVFEYLPGGSLRRRLTSRGRLPLAEAFRVADEVAGALEAAHRRDIIHRDVKPSNILFDEEGRAKLADFGIALLSEGGSPPGGQPVEAADFAGTVRYAAPEQLRGGRLDGRTDLYALAVVLFEMLVGEPAFPGDSPEELARAVLLQPPPRLSQRSPQWPELDLKVRTTFLAEAQVFFDQALAKPPEQRFSDARWFRQGLRRVSDFIGVRLPELPSPVGPAVGPELEAAVGEARAGLMTATTLGFSFLVLERVPWRGGLWDRLRGVARAHVMGVAERFQDSAARRRLSVALARLRVRALERELTQVEARAQRLRAYAERGRGRAHAWQERASQGIARVDEAGARLAAMREADAREAARHYDEQAESQRARSLALRGAVDQARRELDEAQSLWDLAVSRRDRARQARRLGRLWHLRWRQIVGVLVLAVVLWTVWQLVWPGRISEEAPGLRTRLLPSAFTPVGTMAEAREDHTATLLADGRVLVVGGCSAQGRAIGMSETYDPSGRRFLLGPALLTPRFNHTATCLDDGSVLIVGGEVHSQRSDALASAERLVTDQGAVATGSLTNARCRHAAVRLGDGSVLVLGGQDARGKVLASVERYLPEEERFEAAPPLRVPRKDASVVLLADDSVLVVGGDDDEMQPLASVELLRPGAQEWEQVGPLAEARYEATVTLLGDGRVLVVGGGRSPRHRLASIELFDPDQGRSRVVGRLRYPRRVHTATRFVADGREMVLVVGGAGGTEGASSEMIVRQEAGGKETWQVEPGPSLCTPRMNHGAVLLPGEGLLAVGGYDPVAKAPLKSVELLPLTWDDEGVPGATR